MEVSSTRQLQKWSSGDLNLNICLERPQFIAPQIPYEQDVLHNVGGILHCAWGAKKYQPKIEILSSLRDLHFRHATSAVPSSGIEENFQLENDYTMQWTLQATSSWSGAFKRILINPFIYLGRNQRCGRTIAHLCDMLEHRVRIPCKALCSGNPALALHLTYLVWEFALGTPRRIVRQHCINVVESLYSYEKWNFQIFALMQQFLGTMYAIGDRQTGKA